MHDTKYGGIMYKLFKLNIHDVAVHSFFIYLILGLMFIIPLCVITTAVSDEAVSAGYNSFFTSDVIPAVNFCVPVRLCSSGNFAEYGARDTV